MRASAANSEMHARSKSSHGKIGTAQHSTAQRVGVWIAGCVTSSHQPFAIPSSPGHLFAISPSAFTIGTRSFPVHSGLDNARVQPSTISSRPPRPLLLPAHRPSLSGPLAPLRIHPGANSVDPFLVPPTLGAAFSCVASEGSTASAPVVSSLICTVRIGIASRFCRPTYQPAISQIAFFPSPAVSILTIP